jgi:hypothetical protein
LFVYVFGKSSAFFHHAQKFTKQALLEFSLTVTDLKKNAQQAQFPAIERNFQQTSAHLEICSSSN